MCVCVCVFQIRSDKENFTRIIYSLSGPGVDQDPVGVFSVNPQTGYVKIHTILDREEYSSYHVRTRLLLREIKIIQHWRSHPQTA